MRNTKSPIAETAVRHIAALYAIEADVRGHAPEARLAARKKLSAPIVEALKPWFEKQLSLISSGSTLAADIRYALSHWAGLTRFLEDGRLLLYPNSPSHSRRPSAKPHRGINAMELSHGVKPRRMVRGKALTAERAPASAPKAETSAAPVMEIEVGDAHVWIWRDADVVMATAILRALQTALRAK